jgi:DNA-binding MarR family transcriptional regulator
MVVKNQQREEQQKRGGRAGGGAAFLVAQLGTHAAHKFAERVAEIGLTPPLVGILRALANDPGCSQQRLATRLDLLPSKMVTYVDELESLDLVRRKRSTADRRQYELSLTANGESTIRRIGALARSHDRELCQALDADEREALVELLGRIAEQQGLTPGVHPGFKVIGERT